MRFNSETERLLHPQAGLVPMHIWKKYDFDDFDEELLALMQAENIPAIAAIVSLNPVLLDNRFAVWLASVFAHPAFSFKDYRAVASLLDLNLDTQLQLAVVLGNLDYFNYLLGLFPPLTNLTTELVRELGYSGRADILNSLARTPDYLLKIVEANAFGFAAQAGHLDFLRSLVELAPAKVSDMMLAKDYYAFRLAAHYGHLDVLRYLVELAPQQVREMLAARRFYVFRFGALNLLDDRRFEILNYLIGLAMPEQKSEIVAACSFEPFHWAARRGQLKTMRLWVALAEPEQVTAMLINYNFCALRWAVESDQEAVISYLLSFPVVFAYAEQDIATYGEVLWSYVENLLQQLQNQKNAMEGSSSEFDLANEEEAQRYFLVLRHLIRRNNVTLHDAFELLLALPSVKRLVIADEENTLLRLGLRLNNHTASELLLAIPEISQRAEANDFYQAERDIDLSAIADDRESSMVALTAGEQQRLNAVEARYQPLLAQLGVPQCMANLRTTLQTRYEADPAIIIRGEVRMELPFAWESFASLLDNLTATEREIAFQAYYQHPDHTAWRYLAKPNPWMHPHAEFVNVNQNNSQERWSAFEEYQPLISLLYLAAIDETTPPIDDHTFESRLLHFIQALACLGRCHNWDRRNEAGNEYDDLEGDRPSCFSGVKRRLFQAVPGHPLLVFLTRDKLKDEVRAFVWDHFNRSITVENVDMLQTAYNSLVNADALNSAQFAALQHINISEPAQQGFREAMAEKYGTQFTSDFVLQRELQVTFILQEGDNHFSKFLYLGLESILATKQAAKGLAQQGLFGSQAPGADAAAQPTRKREREEEGEQVQDGEPPLKRHHP